MKLKDYVTMGNLLCGFLSVIMIIRGDFTWACLLIYIGYAFDVADGWVARWTKQFDKFGGEFDAMCDYVTNSIAPSFILYYFFLHAGQFPWIAAAAVGAFPITLGTIRHARGYTKPLSYPCYWLGLPRPVYTLCIIAFIHSSLFLEFAARWHWQSFISLAVVVAGISFLHLSYFPFVNHHKRRWRKMLSFGWRIFAGTPIAWGVGYAIFRTHDLLFDYLTFCLFIYLFVAWTQIPNEDWLRIKHFVESGELIEPLVHQNDTWEPATLAAKWEH